MIRDCSFRQLEPLDIAKKETSSLLRRDMLTVAKRSTHNNQEAPMYYSGVPPLRETDFLNTKVGILQGGDVQCPEIGESSPESSRSKLSKRKPRAGFPPRPQPLEIAGRDSHISTAPTRRGKVENQEQVSHFPTHCCQGRSKTRPRGRRESRPLRRKLVLCIEGFAGAAGA